MITSSVLAVTVNAANDEALTLVEAARFLKSGPKVLRRLAKLRAIPHRKIDRRGTLRFSRLALEAWLQSGGAK